MRILVSNDDGIRSPGLWTLVRELSKVARVTVVAPDREQSGVGTSVTFHQPLRVKEEPSEVKGVSAYSVEGTPGDSIILALRLPLIIGVPDLVVSGINEGANLGDDVFISGTVGAALQGYLNGIPAVSMSVNSAKVSDFTPAATVARLLAVRLGDGVLPGKILLNVNLPHLPMNEIRDLQVTRLANRTYADHIQEGGDGRRRHYWLARGTTQWHAREGTDHWAVQRSMVSVTPLMANPLRAVRTVLGGIIREVSTELRATCNEEQKVGEC
ncbi:MAG: 5'/3'-nucleotidase SurE [Chloroflexi bacterium]|nr:5'/3'-nucleotidase SurE [Chloroflexota bacterium]